MTFTHTIAPRFVSIRFSEKPPDDVRSILKAHGFRWSPQSGAWSRNRVTGAADVFSTIDKALRPADWSDAPCWSCRRPGRFRNRGAAAPVYCDHCDKIDRMVRGETVTYPANPER